MSLLPIILIPLAISFILVGLKYYVSIGWVVSISIFSLVVTSGYIYLLSHGAIGVINTPWKNGSLENLLLEDISWPFLLENSIFDLKLSLNQVDIMWIYIGLVIMGLVQLHVYENDKHPGVSIAANLLFVCGLSYFMADIIVY